MVFFKYTIAMAVLANVYGALLAAPFAQPPSPYVPYVHPSPPPVVVHAAPPPPPPPPVVYHAAPHHAVQFVPIVSQTYDASPDGSYAFSYESGDGSSRQEQGFARSPIGSEGPGGVAVQGRFVYPSAEGPVQTEYIADENGYQPSGSHIHPEIVKAVAAQVAFARAEGSIGTYHAPPPPPPPPTFVKAYTAVPPPPPPPVYQFKA